MNGMIRSFNELTPEAQTGAGGKGGSLARLLQAGFPVPGGFVILPTAFGAEGLEPEAWSQVQAYLARMRNEEPGMAFAVRSSALSEDSTQASFAGEFETVLNVSTDEEIQGAIHKVHASRGNERVQAYSRARGMNTVHEVAVIVQRLVYAESSGVLFTANPVDGRRDQAMISAAWGLGEAVVGGLVTPDTLILDKTTGHMLTRATADKQLMTVLCGSGTRTQPVPEEMRRAPAITDRAAVQLVQLGVRIEALYGIPVDIEWAITAGEKIFILQARPITSLPQPAPLAGPEPPVSIQWKLPKGSYALVRNNIIELMADPLTPLFGSLGRAAINASFGRLLEKFFGRPGVLSEEAILTVNGYAYYNGSLKPRDILRIFLGSPGIMKRMFTGAVERWTETGRPNYLAVIKRWQAEPWQNLPADEILGAVRELAEAAIDAYGALVSGVIPAAWISEGLFTFVYNSLIKRRTDPPAPVFLMGFDSLPILAEKSLFDLANWAGSRPELAAYLRNTPAAQLSADRGNSRTPPGVDAEDWRDWLTRFQAHLQAFGHTIYNLDFANPVPADDPEPLLETCRLFMDGQGSDPYTRQQAAVERREAAVLATLDRLKGLRLRLFRKFLTPAQRYAPLREDGLADIGLGYPLLRQMLLELGRRFAEAGAITQADDIFWLVQEEVEQAAACIDQCQTLNDLSAQIPERKAAWQKARQITPPLALPQFKFFGIDLRQLRLRRSRQSAAAALKGAAASPGIVTAPARVLHGPEDFSELKPGEVLVAALTTPAWTPLFARAAAIVTDVGGPLSHGSIVAREYGIPAVLGTGQATKRILSGQTITVDGSAGVVTLPK